MRERTSDEVWGAAVAIGISVFGATVELEPLRASIADALFYGLGFAGCSLLLRALVQNPSKSASRAR